MRRYKKKGGIGISRTKNEPSINAPIQYPSEQTEGSQTQKTAIAEGQSRVYDENLLERARTQWQFGDWESLAKLQREAIENHPERAQLALLAAAGCLQINNISGARQMLILVREWGGSKKLIGQILVAGIHNTLGCASAIVGLHSRALNHFENAIAIGLPNSDRHLLVQARVNQQYLALGLLPPRKIHSNHETLIDPEDVISQALNLLPQEPALLIAGAEAAMQKGQYDEAIRKWQQLASIEGENMPMAYYDRLLQAYAQQKSFPLGAPEEETLIGDGDKYEQLKKIHDLLKPKSYLEIGVQTGKSLALASCPAIGVDPMPQIKVNLGNNVKLVRATSDDFFSKDAIHLIRESLGLVFIDGMHLFEYALRDFINVERYSSLYTLVVIDDIYPGHPAQADRNRRTRAWTGDVWKLFAVLKEYRPDLLLQSLDAYPTGLLMITGLDPKNDLLSRRYDEIVARYAKMEVVPDTYIQRTGAWSCIDFHFSYFINTLVRARQILQSRDSYLNDLRSYAVTFERSIKKLVIYTAIAGGIDRLREPKEITPGADYICFTDNPNINSSVWEIRPLPMTEYQTDNVRWAKMIKLLPHLFLSDYELSVWVDGNISIERDITDFVAISLSRYNAAFFKHPENRLSIQDEANVCIKLKKDDPNIIKQQISDYQAAGLPMNAKVVAGMVIVRRHNEQNIKLIMDDWWDEIKKYSRRDQISFPFVAYIHKFSYQVIEDNVRDNPYFKWSKHDNPSNVQPLSLHGNRSDP
jgi:tetratricopeptide (TPR) repeat protein